MLLSNGRISEDLYMISMVVLVIVFFAYGLKKEIRLAYFIFGI